MRRWNGWGDTESTMELPDTGLSYLKQRVAPGCRLTDAGLAEVCATVPESRLDRQNLPADLQSCLHIDAETRLRHARGQSLPDWLALRSGAIGCYPDAVALPESGTQVRSLLDYCRQQNLIVIPYGGGTSVAGHINPLPDERPIITVALTRMNDLLDLDAESLIATMEAGAAGPRIESQLRARGYTLGHFPQSFELSTLGGWVASRSSGQQSLRYGRIEQLFSGGRLETLAGTLELPSFPASAAGPDLRELVLGSEGRLGILTEARIRVSPLPESELFEVWFFPDWLSGCAAARSLVQGRVPLSMLRLSNPVETETQLALAGHARAVQALESYLRWRGVASSKCLLTVGFTGTRYEVQQARRRSRSIRKAFRGISTGRRLGNRWAAHRFRMPYLREALWEQGYVVDTLETATDWSNVDALMTVIESTLQRTASELGHRLHVFSHLSHVYSQGCSIYTTYVWPVAEDCDRTQAQWRELKQRTSRAIVNQGGTISHQHGVGKDHAAYLPQEKGRLGIQAIGTLLKSFDPAGQLCPGTLLDPNALQSGRSEPDQSAADRETPLDR